MKTDEGVLSISLLTLAVALVVLLSVGLPLVLAPEPIKVSDWLGFGGTFVGAAVAFVVARIAVGPALRQVRIMGAQAAMQLLPAIKEELALVDGDAAFIASLEGFQMKLQHITAQVDFWDDAEQGKLFDLIASELIESRRVVDVLKPKWPQFAERLELSSIQRGHRAALRDVIEHAARYTYTISRTFQPPEGESLGSHKRQAATINAQATNRIHDIINVVGHSLGEHRAMIRTERERLIVKGDALRRAASDVA